MSTHAQPPDPRLSLVVAYAHRRAIGVDNHLPWHLPADLRHFRALTLGHALIMGRRTHESIGRLLPGRRTAILSRDPAFRVDGARCFPDLATALAGLADEPLLFVVGGAQVYATALPWCSRIHATEIDLDVAADRYFPAVDPALWAEAWREHHPAAPGTPAHDFVRYERRDAP